MQGMPRDWAQIAKDLKPVYTAASEAEALDRFAEFSGKWEKRYPAIIRLWENAGERLGGIRALPGLRPGNQDGDLHDQRDRVGQRPAAPRRERPRSLPDQAALKCLYLAIMSLDPTGRGRQRWTNRWKAALNAFDITFDGRLSAGRK